MGSLGQKKSDIRNKCLTRILEAIEHRRADALTLVAEAALNGGLDSGTRGDRYQVVVHVDETALEAGEQKGASVLAGSGDLRFISPKGRRIHEVPTAPAVSNDAACVLIERLLEDGIQIEPMDNLPTWDGRPIDLNTTVQYLLSTRNRPSATGGSAETPVL